VLARLGALAAETAVSPGLFAIVHGALGEHAAARDALEAACAEGTPAMVRLGAHPELDPLRDSPRFAALLARLRLA
jgi:hypothetical protein